MQFLQRLDPCSFQRPSLTKPFKYVQCTFGMCIMNRILSLSFISYQVPTFRKRSSQPSLESSIPFLPLTTPKPCFLFESWCAYACSSDANPIPLKPWPCGSRDLALMFSHLPECRNVTHTEHELILLQKLHRVASRSCQNALLKALSRSTGCSIL